MGHDSLRNILERSCKRAGVLYLSPHKLRHTFASIQLAEGLPVGDVSAVMGHADVSTTLNRYQTSYEAGRRAMALNLSTPPAERPTLAKTGKTKPAKARVAPCPQAWGQVGTIWGHGGDSRKRRVGAALPSSPIFCCPHARAGMGTQVFVVWARLYGLFFCDCPHCTRFLRGGGRYLCLPKVFFPCKTWKPDTLAGLRVARSPPPSSPWAVLRPRGALWA